MLFSYLCNQRYRLTTGPNNGASLSFRTPRFGFGSVARSLSCSKPLDSTVGLDRWIHFVLLMILNGRQYLSRTFFVYTQVGGWSR